ncbi:hypothetical protein [Nonomuraea africana]|uniref:Disulfide bond formation protein B n=1 Tax=Nonomuraea africana TaxID=46171 RepID=A0ABR9KV24_9ACTN|nr:hypothetical protein [Nonomuraea africana]MBE1565468.1 hypothetical protein [Nonomuraea africana]
MTDRPAPPSMISGQRTRLIVVACAGALGMAALGFFGLIEIGWSGVCGGATCPSAWKVGFLGGTVVLVPAAATLFAFHCCSFSLTGPLRKLLTRQALGFLVAGVVWSAAMGILSNV